MPEGVHPEVAGPLQCGGITVFNPPLEFAVLPTSRVGVVGVGGLGHMALRFAKAWGCEVTAFAHYGQRLAHRLADCHRSHARLLRALRHRAGSGHVPHSGQ